MPTLAVGMWWFSRVFNMPTASVGMAPDLPQQILLCNMQLRICNLQFQICNPQSSS